MASFKMVRFSFWEISESRLTISSIPAREKSKRWHRETMVFGSLFISVVARIKIICLGGSSRVFSKALKDSVVSICTSSIIYTLYGNTDGRNLTFRSEEHTSELQSHVNIV